MPERPGYSGEFYADQMHALDQAKESGEAHHYVAPLLELLSHPEKMLADAGMRGQLRELRDELNALDLGK